MILSALFQLFHVSTRTRHPSPISKKRACRRPTRRAALLLERLEDRLAPATLNPGDIVVTDSGMADGLLAVVKVDPASGAQQLLSSGGFFSAPTDVTVSANGDVFVVDASAFGGPGGVIRVNPASGAQTTVSAGGVFVEPMGIVVAGNGDLIVADYNPLGTGAVVRINPITGAQTVITTGTFHPTDIAIAPNGNLFVVDPGIFGTPGKISRIDPATGVQTVVSSGGNLVEPFGLTVASNGTIYASDASLHAVVRVDPVTGAQTVVSSGGNLQCPGGIAINTAGTLFVNDPCYEPGAVHRVNSTTGAQAVHSYAGYLENPAGIAIVPEPNQPPVADADGPYMLTEGSMVMLNASASTDPDQPNTTLSYTWDLDGDSVLGETGTAALRGDEVGMKPTFSAAALDGPLALTVTLRVTDNGGLTSTDTATIMVNNTPLQPGDLIVVDIDIFGGHGKIVKVDPTTGAQNLIASGGMFTNPRGVAIDSSGDLIVTEAGRFGGLRGVIRVNPITGSQTLISSGGNLLFPIGIAIAPNGDLLIADTQGGGGGGAIIRLNPLTGAQAIVSVGGSISDPHGIAIAANGDLFLGDLGAYGPGSIIRVNPTTGAQTVISAAGNFYDPSGLDIAANGDLIVADQNAGPNSYGLVIRVNPVTGAQTVVSSGGTFGDPVDLAIAPNGDIWVADSIGAGGGLGKVVRVDPITGVQTVVSVGGLFNFVGPYAIAIVPNPNQAPIAGAGGPYTIEEGQPLTLNGSASSDPNNDPLSYTWDINGDGVFGDASGVSPTLTWAQLQALSPPINDGPNTFNVKVRVDDGHEHQVTSTAALLNIGNTAPTAALVNSSPVAEGSSVNIVFANPYDPSAADTAAGFRYSYDFNNDGDFSDPGDLAGVSSASAAFTLSRFGSYTVRGRISDKDGGFRDYTSVVVVTDAPIAAAGVAVTATAGAPLAGVVATFVDANPFGFAGEFSATVQWGDGETSTGSIVASGGSFQVIGNHTYAAAGLQPVIVQIVSVGGSTAPAAGTIQVADLGLSVQKGQTATIGFWHNKHGQNLIQSFNGGPNATTLATWLATMLPNLFGAGAGGNNLTGKTNADVATLFVQLFRQSGPKLEAQILATALNVYATTLSLGGTVGQAYGFRVTDYGLGASAFNVGGSGAAFGVPNNTTLNVYQILRAANQRAATGFLFSGDRRMRSLANDVFSGINEAGNRT